MPMNMNTHNDICLDFICLYFINVNGLTFELNPSKQFKDLIFSNKIRKHFLLL